MELNIIHNPEENRFETHVDGLVALVEYILTETKLLVITHTYVPQALEGKGIAAALTKTLLEYARENGLTIHPLCPYAVAYFRKHPEYNSLLRKN